MVERRDVMSGGLLTGLAALVAPAGAAAVPQGDDDQRIVSAVDNLRQTVESRFESLLFGPWRGIAKIRQEQRNWLKSTSKYPDFIEVGIDVWDSLYEWHVRYQQPVNVARMTDGRYAMVFMFTTVLLRPDALPEYVSYPFDAESQRAPR
jgi:hypothetical protein